MIYNETKYNREWKTYKLEQLGTFSRGKSKHRPRNDSKLFEGGGYPLIQTGDVKKANLYIKKHNEEYNEFGLSQSKLWDKDTLCITIAANIAETALLKYPMCFPDSIVGFKSNKELCTELFMHYIFTYIKESIQKSASGSIQDNINIDYLKKLDFKIPSLDIQRKIVSILYSIDKKIENNDEINKELENMMEAVYNYWFLQFDFPNKNGKPYKSSGGKMVWNEVLNKEIPEGWKVRKIKDFLIENDKSTVQVVKVKEKNEGDYPFFTSGEEIYKYNQYFIDGENCFLSTGGNANVKVYSGKAAYSTDTWCISMDNGLTSYLYMWLYSLGDGINKTYFAGTGLKHFQKDLFRNTSLYFPPNEVIMNFNELVERNIKIISYNYQENEELKSLRDFLLPLLMNGQINYK